MTRMHAAHQVLRLGPLSLPDFVEVTGWRYRSCVRTLQALRRRGLIRNVRRGNQSMPSMYEAIGREPA